MRTSPALLGLALAAALLVACGEQGAPAATARDTAAPRSLIPNPTPTSTPTSPTPTSPTPAAPAAAATAIPDHLSVQERLPEDGGDFRWHDRGVSAELCGREVFPVGDLADRRAVTVVGPEYGEGRDLRLFRDVTAAEAFLAAVAERVRACPSSERAGSQSIHDLVRSTLDGDQSFTAVQTYLHEGRPTLGANFWEVVRVGAAVLLTMSYGEYDPEHTLDQGVREHAADVAGIVEGMCVFADDPCAAGPVAGTSTASTVVGPHGLGGLELGTPLGEIEHTAGELTGTTTASGCHVVRLWVNDAPDLVGNLDPDLGLAVIIAGTDSDARTDRGVGTGSTYDEVVAAYPRHAGDEQLLSAPVAGYDDRHWRFWFGPDGAVDEFMLLLDEQHCGG